MIELLKILGPTAIGALLVWIGTLIADRRKRRDSNNEALRRCYVSWFTTESILTAQMKFIIESFERTPNNDEEYIVLIAQFQEVEKQSILLLTALNEAILLETRDVLRVYLKSFTAMLTDMLAFIKDYIAHLRLHVEARAESQRLELELAQQENAEIQKLLEKQITLIKDWDQTCIHSLEKPLKSLAKWVSSIHDRAAQTRDLIEGRFSG